MGARVLRYMDSSPDLGPRQRRYRPRLPLWTATVMTPAAVAGALAVAALLAAAPIVAVALALLIVAGLTARLLVPPDLPYRRITVYERGLELLAPGGATRAVRWTQVRGTWPDPDGSRLVLDEDAGESIRLPRLAFGGARHLAAAVARHTQPLAYERAEADLAGRGRAGFGPIAVAGDGLWKAATDERLGWTEVGSYELRDGRRLLLTRATADGRLVWFDGPVPDPAACLGIMTGHDPAVATPSGRTVLARELDRVTAR